MFPPQENCHVGIAVQAMGSPRTTAEKNCSGHVILTREALDEQSRSSFRIGINEFSLHGSPSVMRRYGSSAPHSRCATTGLFPPRWGEKISKTP